MHKFTFCFLGLLICVFVKSIPAQTQMSNLMQWRLMKDITKHVRQTDHKMWLETKEVMTEVERYEYPESEDYYIVRRAKWNNEIWDTVYMEYRYTDLMGRDSSIVIYKPDGGAWAKDSSCSIQYNEHGQIEEIRHFDWEMQLWIPVRKEFYTFNQMGLPETYNINIRKEGRFVDYLRETYEYNEDRRLVKAQTEFQSGEGWLYHTKKTYDFEGFITFESIYKWQNSSWMIDEKSRITHSTSWKKTRVETEYYKNGNLIRQQKVDISYGRANLNGIITGYNYYELDLKTNVYNNTKKVKYEYDDDARLVLICTEERMPYNDWVKVNRYTYSYLGESDIFTSEIYHSYEYEFNEAFLRPSMGYLWEYDARGRLKKKINISYYKGKQYINNYIEFFYEDQDSVVRSEMYTNLNDSLRYIFETKYYFDENNRRVRTERYNHPDSANTLYDFWEYKYTDFGMPDSVLQWSRPESDTIILEKVYDYEYIYQNGEYLLSSETNIDFYSEGEISDKSQRVYIYRTTDNKLQSEKLFIYNCNENDLRFAMEQVYFYENGRIFRSEKNYNAKYGNRVYYDELVLDSDLDPTQIQSYEIIDDTVRRNARWIDIEYLEPSSVALPAAEANIRIFPNPAAEEVSLELPEASDAAITIYDINGVRRMMFRLPAAKTHRLPISELPAGAYMMQIETGGKQYSEKLIIQ